MFDGIKKKDRKHLMGFLSHMADNLQKAAAK